MPFLRTGGKCDHAARVRRRAGGGAMFLRMVSSFVVNLGCQTFEIQPILYLGCQTFCIKGASNPRHFAGKFPKRRRSATVPLDRETAATATTKLRDFDDLELLKLIQEAGSKCYDMSHLLW